MASPSAWSVVPEGSASQWTPVKDDPATPDKPSLASDFAKYSPIGMVQSIANGIRHPIDTARSLANMPAENAKLLDKAKESFDKGNYSEAAVHFLNYVNPVGSAMEDAGADFQHGDYAHGLAKTAGLATSMVASAKAPQIMDKLGDAADAAPRVLTAAKEGIKAAAPDVAIGATKIATGAALPKIPGVSYGLEYAGGKQALKGLSKGVDAFKAALNDKVAAVAQAAATEAADPVLNAVAQMQGHADFSAAPAEAQVGIRAAASKIPAEMTPEQVAAFTGEPPSAPQSAPTTAQAPTPVTAPPVQPLEARPATAPVAAQAAQSSAPAGLSIAEQLRDEMLRNGTIQPSQVVGAPQAAPIPAETNLQDLMRNPASSTARAPEWIRQKEMASSEPKAVADGLYAEGKQTPEQAGAVYQAAARADKAVKLAQALHSGGITYADALKLEPGHWADIAKSLGVNKPSKTSIGEALFRLQRLEAAAKPPVGGIQ